MGKPKKKKTPAATPLVCIDCHKLGPGTPTKSAYVIPICEGCMTKRHAHRRDLDKPTEV